MAESLEERAVRLASQNQLFMNFVDFTSGLIRGVFDTLVDVTQEQLRTYVDMVTALSGGPDQFILKTLGDIDTAALKYLNEVVLPEYTTETTLASASDVTSAKEVTLKTGQETALNDSFAGVDVNGDGTSDALTITAGKVQLSQLYDFTKAFLERAGRRSFDELQALLRLGLARVVPNKGFVETALTFSIETTSTFEQTTSVSTNDVASKKKTFIGGFSNDSTGNARWQKIAWGTFNNKIDARNTSDKSDHRITVSVVNQKTTGVTNLDIDITGRVHIDFVTDYFPLLPAPEVAQQQQ